MSTSRVFAGTTAAMLSIVLLSPETAFAQSPSAGEDNRVIEEITVTARRREESLLRVPEQITVFTAADIEKSRIANYQDFSERTPNFQAFENFRRGVFNITVRGIPTVQGGEPPVAILVDGVQTAALDFVNQDLFDLESIQILRGPHGATYGRGAIGGALLIATKPPGDALEARAQASWTSAIEEYRLNASVSGPIVEDKLAAGVSGTYADRRGFLTNSLAGGYCDFSEEKTARAQMRLTPSESLTVQAKFNYLDGYNYGTCVTKTTDADPFLGNGRNVPEDLPRDFKQYDDRRIRESVLKLDWSTGFGKLVSASGLQKGRSFSPGDTDFGPVVQPLFFENLVEIDAWNTNLYWTSERQSPLTWILGGFYQHRETVNALRVGRVPLPLAPPFLVNRPQFDLSESRAIYGEATFSPTQKLELSLSLRYDEDKRESVDRSVPTSFLEETFTALQPHASIAYFWSDRLTTYVSTGKGFRSGGFNALGDILVVGLTDRRFEKETATNYELGFKGSALGGRLIFSGAVFHTNFENQQYFLIRVGPPGARVVVSLPKTTFNGAELEAVARPFNGLELRGAWGIADGEIEEGGAFGLDGAHSPNAHRDTLNVSAQYDIPVASAISLRPRVEYEHRGPIYYDAFDRFRHPATNFVNATLTVEGGRWALVGFARNLTDERLPTIFNNNTFDGGTRHGYLQNLPRRYGVEFRMKL